MFMRKCGLGDQSCGPSWIKKLDQERAASLGEVKGCVAGIVKSRRKRYLAERM